MPKLQWDKIGERFYETGTSKGVLFPQSNAGTYETGVAWSGLSAVRQTPDGAEETPIFADDIKYLSLTSVENFNGTIEAYTYPDEFAAMDGSKEVLPGVYVGQQTRRAFGMAYMTVLGNDTEYNQYGQKLHLIYGAKVAPSERAYETVNNDPSAINFSWSFTTTPQQVETPGLRPSAYLAVESTKVTEEQWNAIIEIVHGNETTESRLPSIDEVITIIGGLPEDTGQ